MASVEAVWKAWTIRVLDWFGSDPNGKGVSASIDLRPGGYYEITFKDVDQTEHTCSGIYKEVKEFNTLSFSWMWKSEPGVESFVTVELAVEGNATKMRFTHTHLGTVSAHNYLAGWLATFSKLEKMLLSQL